MGIKPSDTLSGRKATVDVFNRKLLLQLGGPRRQGKLKV
jgi:hypothetical protein